MSAALRRLTERPDHLRDHPRPDCGRRTATCGLGRARPGAAPRAAPTRCCRGRRTTRRSASPRTRPAGQDAPGPMRRSDDHHLALADPTRPCRAQPRSPTSAALAARLDGVGEQLLAVGYLRYKPGTSVVAGLGWPPVSRSRTRSVPDARPKLDKTIRAGAAAGSVLVSEPEADLLIARTGGGPGPAGPRRPRRGPWRGSALARRGPPIAGPIWPTSRNAGGWVGSI